jgi:RHS repeat-associated protein
MWMDFQCTNSGDMQIGHLRERYLWGPAVDQILAEEAVDGGTADLVQWTLTDHLNTVRDIARFDPQTGNTTVVNHLIYDAFGKVTSETNSAVASLLLFTARPFDPDTALQNNLNRWYDSRVGRWLSEDPLEVDPNFYRYCGNNPVPYVDPTGLWVWPWDPNADWVWPWDPNATWEPAFLQAFDIIATEMEKVWGQLQDALCGLAKPASNSNIVTCACFVMGVADMAPGVGQVPLVEKADCACNVLTAANLYCNKQFTRAAAYGLLTAIDCMSIELGELLGVPLGGAIGTVLNPGVGTAGGAAVGAVFGDALVDVAAFAVQNYITQGTVLPQAQVNACCQATKEAANALKAAFDKLVGILGK